MNLQFVKLRPFVRPYIDALMNPSPWTFRFLFSFSYFVEILRQNFRRLNDKENVKKIRFDHTRMKWRVLFLKNDADDVISNMSFSLNLRRIVEGKR